MGTELFVVHPGVGQNRAGDGAILAQPETGVFKYMEQQFIDADKATHIQGIVVPPGLLPSPAKVRFRLLFKQNDAGSGNVEIDLKFSSIAPPAGREGATPVSLSSSPAIFVAPGLNLEEKLEFEEDVGLFTSGEEILLTVNRVPGSSFSGKVSLVRVDMEFPIVSGEGANDYLGDVDVWQCPPHTRLLATRYLAKDLSRVVAGGKLTDVGTATDGWPFDDEDISWRREIEITGLSWTNGPFIVGDDVEDVATQTKQGTVSWVDGGNNKHIRIVMNDGSPDFVGGDSIQNIATPADVLNVVTINSVVSAVPSLLLNALQTIAAELSTYLGGTIPATTPGTTGPAYSGSATPWAVATPLTVDEAIERIALALSINLSRPIDCFECACDFTPDASNWFSVPLTRSQAVRSLAFWAEYHTSSTMDASMITPVEEGCYFSDKGDSWTLGNVPNRLVNAIETIAYELWNHAGATPGDRITSTGLGRSGCRFTGSPEYWDVVPATVDEAIDALAAELATHVGILIPVTPETFIGLGDTPLTYTGQDGKLLQVNEPGSEVVFTSNPFGGTNQGDVLFYDGTSWVALGAGADGRVLTTHSTGADPTWEIHSLQTAYDGGRTIDATPGPVRFLTAGGTTNDLKFDNNKQLLFGGSSDADHKFRIVSFDSASRIDMLTTGFTGFNTFDIEIKTGNSGFPGLVTGDIVIATGYAFDTASGSIELKCGNISSGTPGDIDLWTGFDFATSTRGDLDIRAQEISVSGKMYWQNTYVAGAHGLRIPKFFGTPSTIGADEAEIVWDATGKNFLAYNGASWVTIGGSGTHSLQIAYNGGRTIDTSSGPVHLTTGSVGLKQDNLQKLGFGGTGDYDFEGYIQSSDGAKELQILTDSGLTDQSWAIRVETGTSVSYATGDILLSTGFAGGVPSSGDLELRTGSTTSSAPGKILIQAGWNNTGLYYGNVELRAKETQINSWMYWGNSYSPGTSGLRLPQFAGTPTTIGVLEGEVVWNSSANQILVFDGVSWVVVGGGGVTAGLNVGSGTTGHVFKDISGTTMRFRGFRSTVTSGLTIANNDGVDPDFKVDFTVDNTVAKWNANKINSQIVNSIGVLNGSLLGYDTGTASWNANTIDTAATGDLAYWHNGIKLWRYITPGAAGTYLQSTGPGSVPTWGTPAGTVPSGTTNGEMLYWNGASWVLVTAPAGAGLYLQSTAGMPIWTAGLGGTSLDGAYDFGGAGAGRTITVDSGAVALAPNSSNHALDISYSSINSVSTIRGITLNGQLNIGGGSSYAIQINNLWGAGIVSGSNFELADNVAIYFGNGLDGSVYYTVDEFRINTIGGGATSTPIRLKTGDAAAAGTSGGIDIFTGDASGGTSGSILLQTSSTASIRGDIGFISYNIVGNCVGGGFQMDADAPSYIDTAASDATLTFATNAIRSDLTIRTTVGESDILIDAQASSVNIKSYGVALWQTYETTNVSSSDLTIRSGNVTSSTTSAVSGDVVLVSGNTNDAASGSVTIESGAVSGAYGQTGHLYLRTGAQNNLSQTSFFSGSIYLQSGACANYYSGSVNIASGSSDLGSGDIEMQTGVVNTSGPTGDMFLHTGNNTSPGGTGELQIYTGTMTGGGTAGTGQILFQTGGITTGSGNSGLLKIGSGTSSGSNTGRSGHVELFSGQNTSSSSTQNTGTVSIYSGNLTAGGGGTGSVLMYSGDVSTSTGSASGLVSIFSGTSASLTHNTGSVVLATGNQTAGSGSLSSGSFFAATGTSRGKTGDLSFASGNSSQGESGDFIFSTGTGVLETGSYLLTTGVSSSRSSGLFRVTTGDVNHANTGYRSGNCELRTGASSATRTEVVTGDVYFVTGNSTGGSGTPITGQIWGITGNSASGTSGRVRFQTGSAGPGIASDYSGNIEMVTGSAVNSSQRGDFKVDAYRIFLEAAYSGGVATIILDNSTPSQPLAIMWGGSATPPSAANYMEGSLYICTTYPAGVLRQIQGGVWV